MPESLGMTQIGENTPDNLFAGDFPIITEEITIASGAGALTRGTLLGKISLSVPTTGTFVSGTGNGTITDVTGSTATIIETFTLTCTVAAANGGTFSVVGSKTGRLADTVVGTAYTSEYINLTVNDGATDFAVGDKFTIAVAAGSNEYQTSLAAAVDGSQTPDCILARAVDASAAAVVCEGYFSGEFNQSAITYGTGHTAVLTKAGLKTKGIHLKSVVAA